ncbi:CaiB/BaiF CoA transferase family protein [Pseudonocardia lutea]|uniref:CaiB/BaiF CoA transferase family protein n=1 Tax=Pseudonocardia lutea TaxID=2172015 RepID=A0ABW1IGC0_9PSEU
MTVPTLPLAGVRVVELDDGDAQYTGMLLAALGADVVKVEPPGGAPARSAGPFVGGVDDGAHSLPFLHYNVAKRSVVLDLDRPADRAALHELVAAADVLLDGLGPNGAAAHGLDDDTLEVLAPGLVHVLVTPFGRTGPWRDHRASDVVSMSLGGVTGQTGYDAVGDEPGTPITPVGHQPRHFGGVLAAVYAVAALRDRPAHRVRTLDVALHDSIAVSTEIPVSLWEFGGQEVFRHTGRHAAAVLHNPEWQFRCADGGYLCALTLYLNDRRFAAILDWFDGAGFAHDLHAERFVAEADRVANMAEIVDAIARFCAGRDSVELFHEAQRRALPWARIQPVAAVAADPHLHAREFFTPVEGPDGTPVPHPGLPWRGMPTVFTAPPGRVRAPHAGEDTATVLGTLRAADPVAGG